uniref:Immunoglobulin V-set domain-containing protein n=1 Tax=Chrysemys picta bellii TaxID=8478 RepID=A0A8C3FKS6_CHRPI
VQKMFYLDCSQKNVLLWASNYNTNIPSETHTMLIPSLSCLEAKEFFPLSFALLALRYATSNGKYSSKVDLTANNFSLTISNVQRNDSGIYYCGLSASVYVQPNFGTGTRLIVTGEFPMGQNNDIAMLAGAVKNLSSFFARLGNSVITLSAEMQPLITHPYNCRFVCFIHQGELCKDRRKYQ